MIARVWRGWVATADTEAYVRYIEATGIAAYTATPGNRGAWMLTRGLDDGRTEIVTLSFWTSLDAVKAFAGPDPGQAVFYPEDDRYLVDRETTVTHFEIAATGAQPGLSPVREMRVAFTVPDFDAAVRFYADGLRLPVVQEWDSPTGRGRILDAGRATLELLDPAQTALVDRVETGSQTPTSGPVRFALEVEDSVAAAESLVAAGAERVADAVVTPWSHRNVRLRAPDGMQLTLFTVLDEADRGTSDPD